MKAGSWCQYKRKACGQPDAEGIASFCDETCWKAAGSPRRIKRRP